MEKGLYNVTISGKFLKKEATIEFTQCDKVVKGTLSVGKKSDGSAKKVYELNGKFENDRLDCYGSYVVIKPHFVTIKATAEGDTFSGDIEFNENKKTFTAVKA